MFSFLIGAGAATLASAEPVGRQPEPATNRVTKSALCYFFAGTTSDVKQVERIGGALIRRAGGKPIFYFSSAQSGFALSARVAAVNKLMLENRNVASCEEFTPFAPAGAFNIDSETSLKPGWQTAADSISRTVDYEIDLTDSVSDEDLGHVIAATLVEHGDGTGTLTLTMRAPTYCEIDYCYPGGVPMSGGLTTSSESGRPGSTTTQTHQVRDSGQTTVTGTFKGNISILGRGVEVKGTVTVQGPRTVTTTSTTTAGRGGSGGAGGSGGTGGGSTGGSAKKRFVKKH